MDNWWRYCLSFCVVMGLAGCDHLSNETYSHMEESERRRLASEYISLAKRLESGSPAAMLSLEKATRLDPRNEIAWKDLASPYLRTGQYDQWHAYMEKAIALNPGSSQAERGRDRLHFLRDYAGALYDFDMTDSLTQDRPDYIRNTSVDYLRGLCYYGLDNDAKAEQYFDLYIQVEEEKTGTKQLDNMVYGYKAAMANAAHQYAQAEQYSKAGMSLRPERADLEYQLAYSLFMQGRISEAAAAVERCEALFRDGDYHRSHYYEVIDQLHLGRIEKLKEEVTCFM